MAHTLPDSLVWAMFPAHSTQIAHWWSQCCQIQGLLFCPNFTWNIQHWLIFLKWPSFLCFSDAVSLCHVCLPSCLFLLVTLLGLHLPTLSVLILLRILSLPFWSSSQPQFHLLLGVDMVWILIARPLFLTARPSACIRLSHRHLRYKLCLLYDRFSANIRTNKWVSWI